MSGKVELRNRNNAPDVNDMIGMRIRVIIMIKIDMELRTKGDLHEVLFQIIDTFKVTKPELMAIVEEVEQHE